MLKLLTAEEKQFYNDNGYVHLSNVFSPDEVEEMSEEYDTIFERMSRDTKSRLDTIWQGDWQKDLIPEDNKGDSDGNKIVKSIHNLQFHSATFTRCLVHSRLLDVLEDVMGTEDILLHHTKAHLKPPGTGAPFPMHQDYGYFPFKNDSMVAAFIHLDDSDPNNGGLAVYPGSHKNGPLEDKSSEPGFHHVDQERFPLSGAAPVRAKRGDVVIFSYLLVHGSYLNTSDRVRRMLLIQYYAAHDQMLSERHASPGLGTVLRGQNRNMHSDIAKRHH